MLFPAIFFYTFGARCVAAAFMLIASRNPVHSVLFLILAFVNAAGLFVLLGAEFLAMILIIVYVGAVLVRTRGALRYQEVDEEGEVIEQALGQDGHAPRRRRLRCSPSYLIRWSVPWSSNAAGQSRSPVEII